MYKELLTQWSESLLKGPKNTETGRNHNTIKKISRLAC